jgi:tRNA nucleotidyltransferase (CCA-adding enzyme)
MKLPKILHILAEELAQHHATAIIVGGAVRDHWMQQPVKDYDIEVYGLETLEQLEQILSGYGSVNLVGKSFGVLKFTHAGEEFDLSFPRRESKSGSGHRGFDITVDGEMRFEEAARRRDFSLNAMGYEIQSGTFLDPFGGRADIAQRRLRHIDSDTFIEDPLRVYRAVQFAARFGYTLAPETTQLCREMVAQNLLEELPKERVYTEFVKLLLKAPKPSLGFALMRELGILRYFPELEAIIDVPQNLRWHPEGDVWTHTLMALDTMQQLLSQDAAYSEQERVLFLLAILCHDLGKATTTTIEADGRIRAIGHEHAGIVPTQKLLSRLTDEQRLIAHILPLVEHHLKPSQFYTQGAKSAAIRRLATKVSIEELVFLAKADFLGRSTEEAKSGLYPAGEWLLQQAEKLKVKNRPLPPLIQGRDLIALGLTPSPQFGEILDTLYREQIEGKLQSHEEALAYIKQHFAS